MNNIISIKRNYKIEMRCVVKKFNLIKILSLTLVLVFTFSTMATQTAFASAKTDNSLSIQLQKHMSVNEAIKIIEANYLHLQKDGTFSIDLRAKEVIPKEILNSLESGMNEINNEIKEKKLIVSHNSKGNNVVSIAMEITTKNSIQPNVYAATTSPVVNNYKFFWWGYIANANTVATNILINNLEFLIGVCGAEGAVGAYFTVGASVVIAIATGIFAYDLVRQAKNALAITPNGSTFYAYGSPSCGQLYKVTRLYN